MTTAHVYFADIPLSSPSSSSAHSLAAPEGHRSNFEASPNSDATSEQRQCSRNATERSISPGCNTALQSTPRYERNMGFFRQLSRRFGLRSNDDLVYSGSNEEDNQSSSTDSCSSHRENASKDAQLHKQQQQQHEQLERQYCNASNIMTASMMTMSITEHISCASSETSSTVDIEEQQQQHNLGNSDAKPPEDDDDENHVTTGKQTCHKERKSFARSSFSRLQRRSASSIRRAFENFSLSSRSLSCSGTTPPPPPLSLATHINTSSSSSSSTPIKSALKSTSNLELNKRYNASSANASSSSNSSASAAASGSMTTTTTKSSKTKTKPPPQRILRQPVSYTYLKGISGLPTQRVPRNSVCCQYARR